jgi:glycolate oxidase FAD binding subunit
MSELAYAQQQPSTIDELAFLVAAAEKNNTAVVAGSPGRIPPGSQLTSLSYADVSAFTKVIEYSIPDQVVHVEAGIKLGDLREALAKNNQWWPVYLPDEWTLLEAISRGDSGSVEHRFLSVRDLVLGCTVVTGHAAGIINCGGRVVKNVTGYDMTKLFVGSQGTLGIVVSAQLRLFARPEGSSTLRWEFDSCGEALKLCHDLIDSGLPLYTVSVSKDRPTRLWSVLAQVAGVHAVVEEVVEAAGALTKKKSKRLVGDKDSSLWRRLTAQFYASDEPVVQVVAAPTSLARIAAELAPVADLEVRPRSGRMLVRGAELDTVFEFAAKFADQSAPIVVAGENDRYNYVVRRSPDAAADQVRTQLQARVKARFDPGGVLNPFALL